MSSPFWDPRHPLSVRELRHRSAVGLVLQTILMGVSIAAVFLVLESLEHAVVAASLASSSFLVFLIPHSRRARSRNVLAGHLLGVVPGLGLGSLLPHTHPRAPVLYGGVVIVTGLLMEATRISHPPAVGTSLGLAISPQGWLAVSVVIGATVLATAHHVLAPRLLDLTGHPELGERISVVPSDGEEEPG